MSTGPTRVRTSDLGSGINPDDELATLSEVATLSKVARLRITDLGSSTNPDDEMATRAQVVYISWFIASTMDDL
jgi:hypothetical protein|eukprot:COSAG06_NODE_24744_length_653_cov_2.700361_1_plen_74_part_00